MEADLQSRLANQNSRMERLEELADLSASKANDSREQETTTSPITLRWNLSSLEAETYWLLMVFADMCGMTMHQVAPNKIMTEETAADLMRRWNAGKAIVESHGKSWTAAIYEHSLKFRLPPEYLERCGMRLEAVEETNEANENDNNQADL